MLGKGKREEREKSSTLTLNSSVESQEPIFNSAVKAGAAAEPNSNAEASKGSNCNKTLFDLLSFHTRHIEQKCIVLEKNWEYLLQHNFTRKLLCKIRKLTEESVLFNTVFEIKNFHELYGLQ